MNPDDALLKAWEKTLRGRGERPAVFDSSGAVTRTFGGIEQRAAIFHSQLDSLPRGAVIAIQIGNHPDWPSLLLACLRRGIVVLPLEPSISEQERIWAMELCRASGVFAFVHGCSGDEVVLLRNSANYAGNTGIQWTGSFPSLLKLTSGTTAAPRAIRFRSEQLLADCVNICDSMEISERDLNFGAVPVSHSYGFSNLLTPLLVRAVPLVLTADPLPRAIMHGLAATRATIFAGMPVFYQAFCEMSGLPPLPALRLCISAGAPLNGNLARRFQAKFGLAVHSFYGSSECGGICYARKGDEQPGFVGSPLRGVDVEFVDAEERSSRIRVRSEAVGDGYYPEPDRDRLGGGMFSPDDLLERTEVGYRVVGRVSDLVNVAGKKVNPAEIEAVILRHPGVRAVTVFGRKAERRNEEIAACVEAENSVTEAELLARCRRELSSWQVPRQIVLVAAIPANARGKTSRRELALRFPAMDSR